MTLGPPCWTGGPSDSPKWAWAKYYGCPDWGVWHSFQLDPPLPFHVWVAAIGGYAYGFTYADAPGGCFSPASPSPGWLLRRMGLGRTVEREVIAPAKQYEEQVQIRLEMLASQDREPVFPPRGPMGDIIEARLRAAVPFLMD